jgi:hypothetical protein
MFKNTIDIHSTKGIRKNVLTWLKLKFVTKFSYCPHIMERIREAPISWWLYLRSRQCKSLFTTSLPEEGKRTHCRNVAFLVFNNIVKVYSVHLIGSFDGRDFKQNTRK